MKVNNYKIFSLYKSQILSDERSKKLVFRPDGRNHYVYRITDLNKSKHYYGSRVTRLDPIDDIGIKYFSSSSINEFLKEQKQYPDNFKYKVIKIFDNPGDSILYESYLHQYFDVKNNINFINKSNQTPFGWTTTCNNFATNKANKTMSKIDPKTGKSIRDISKLKFSKTISQIDPKSGNTRAKDIGIKTKNTNNIINPASGLNVYQMNALKLKNKLSKIDPISGLTGYQLQSLHIKDKLSKIDPISGMSGNEKRSKLLSGKNNGKYSGYYITPTGMFESSLLAAENMKISSSAIRSYCKYNKNIISLSFYNKSKFLQSLYPASKIVGKTFKDLGFYFKII